MIRRLIFVAALLLSYAVRAEETKKASIADAVLGADGVLSHTVLSPRQRAATELRVLRPDSFDASKRYPALYLLPVEAARENRYGDALDEVVRLDLHNRFQLLCIAPTFAELPWYADHPTDKQLQQESYLLHDIVPFVDANYPVVQGPSGRLLAGFSKSGWGAFSLLLRNLNVFSRAAAWDAPLNMQESGKYGSGPIFGTQKTFEDYQVTRLLAKRMKELREKPRLFHLGYDNFRKHHETVESLLNSHHISHVYRDGPKRKHVWGSGWLEEAVELLVAEDLPVR
ncbi:MAG: hypothetical protein H8E66_23020 [Planctomycetes bacterium]|nr:hypothetical protein [Planctomycetota bacterium]